MQFKSLAIIICLTAGSVLSAPINHSLDHSLERRWFGSVVASWFQSRRRENEITAKQRIIGKFGSSSSHIAVPPGSYPSNP
jgi:hypothetical protein